MDNKTLVNPELIDNQIVEYLNLLLWKKKVDDLPKEVLEDMVMDLYSRFEQFVFASVMQTMDGVQYAEFEEFLARNPSAEDAYVFLKKNVRDLPVVIQKAMDGFEQIYLGGPVHKEHEKSEENSA